MLRQAQLDNLGVGISVFFTYNCMLPLNKVAVTSNGNTEERLMIFGEVRRGEEKNTNLYSSANFSINGLSLKPYPTSDSAGKINNYVLLVCEDKNN